MRKQAPKEDNPSSTRERLITAALDQLVEYGYRGATSRKIAQAAGVNEITLFRHFVSKEELITTALIDKSEAYRTRFPKPTGALEDDLLRFAEELARSIMEDSAFIFRLIPELSRLPTLQQSVVKRAFNSVYDTMTSFFQYYQHAGILNAEFGDLLSTIFLGPIFTHHYLGELRDTETTFDIRLYVRLFLDGYRTRA